MPTSDWGDWLPRAIADADPNGVSLWYLGCNGIVMKASDGTTIFVDPYLGTGDPPRTIRMIPVPFDPKDVGSADAVLATHEHTDHVHGPSQAPILANTDATFVGPADSVAVAREDEEWTENYDVEANAFKTVEPGDGLEIGSFRIHVEKAHDPDATDPVSYVMEHDAGTIFHGGDTKPSEAFDRIGNEYDIDLGILAFGSVGMIPDKETREPKQTRWYNDENDVVEVASSLQVSRLLPSHWDVWKGLTADPTALYHHVRTYQYPERLEVVEIGDRVDLET